MKYSKNPLIDLLEENNISSGTLTLAAGGSTTVTKTYNDEDKSSGSLLVIAKCYVTGDTSSSYHSFRYSTSVYGVINIEYYADDDEEEIATEQSIVFFPSNLYEKNRALPVKYKIPINSQYIKSVTLTVYNNLSQSIEFSKMVIRREVSEAESYSESTGIARSTLTSLTAYDDGCKIYYSDQESPTKLTFQGDSNGNLTSIIVNQGETTEKTILFNRSSGSVGD